MGVALHGIPRATPDACGGAWLIAQKTGLDATALREEAMVYRPRVGRMLAATVLRAHRARRAPRMGIAEEILAIYQSHGSDAYFGEPVSMSEHALQAAHFARLEDAPPSLVIAALLHDIGHLVDEDVPADIADWKSDAAHELAGCAWLALRFSPAVSEPVRLHVAAKRYLCATQPAYLSRLSSASVVTLRLQGGPMSAGEVARFEQEPFRREAVRLRHWDDQGKISGLATAPFEDYQELLEALAAARGFAAVAGPE
jgi:phosphonate degradation associated HDIG domain protein